MIISVGVAVLLVGGAMVYASRDRTPSVPDGQKKEVVKIVDGKQIIEVSAKGGYYPRKIVAQAGMETILRMKTNGTFDCSSSLAIPKLNYRTSLPPSGTVDIPISASASNGILRGLCSMGMYSFEINFE